MERFDDIKKYLRKEKELCAGLCVLLLCVLFICFVYNRHALRPDADFSLFATFTKVDGLRPGTPVRMGGIQVGSVQSLALTDDYHVRVNLRFEKIVPVPDDTVAMIVSAGFLGPKYIELMVGGSDDMLETGDTLAYTQDVLLIDELFQRVLGIMRTKKGVVAEEESSEGEKE